MRNFVLFLFVFFIIFFSVSATAGPYQEGVGAARRGEFEKAAEKFSAAYQKGGEAKALFNWALAKMKGGSSRRALEVLRENWPESPPDRMVALRRKLEREVGGELLAEKIRRESENFAVWVAEQTAKQKAGRFATARLKKSATLLGPKVAELPISSARSLVEEISRRRAQRHTLRRRRRWGWSLVGAGVGLIGVGSAANWWGVQPYQDPRREIITRRWISAAAWGIGGVAAATGVGLLLAWPRDGPKKAKVRLIPAPRGAGIQVTW